MKKIGVENLKIQFNLKKETIKIIDNLSIEFEEGKIIGIVGESGSGKSVLAMAMLGILPNYATIEGNIILDEKRIKYKSKEQKEILGKKLGFIPQNPQESLNPSRKIKNQLYEVLELKYQKKEKEEKAIELIEKMGFEDVQKTLNSYPYELSGGMQQRVLFALSIALQPQWVIADEPTKGLDKSLCVAIGDNLKKMINVETKGIIVITHDLNFARDICDEIYVMYKGKIIDKGTNILKNPKHKYTKSLIEAMPENNFTPINIFQDIFVDIN